MADQNNKNHRRLLPIYHGVLFAIVLTSIGLSVYSLVKVISNEGEILLPLIVLFLAVGLSVLMILARSFAIKAQDRAIRAEESLRHFILTGKPINPNLRLGQIIALRFASDDELIELTEQAVAKKLNQSQIKSLIKTWKADTHRV